MLPPPTRFTPMVPDSCYPLGPPAGSPCVESPAEAQVVPRVSCDHLLPPIPFQLPAGVGVTLVCSRAGSDLAASQALAGQPPGRL